MQIRCVRCITMHCLALRIGVIPRNRHTDPRLLAMLCAVVHLWSGSRYTNQVSCVQDSTASPWLNDLAATPLIRRDQPVSRPASGLADTLKARSTRKYICMYTVHCFTDKNAAAAHVPGGCQHDAHTAAESPANFSTLSGSHYSKPR